jgi:RimJ/RimL family protein N-acetyltransferase
MLQGKKLTIDTQRLSLRPVMSGDEDILWPHLTNPKISEFMAWLPHQKRAQTEQFVAHEIARIENNQGITWMIFNDEVFCGIVSLIGLIGTHRGMTLNKAEFAYWTVPSIQRQGIMTEACTAVVDFAFKQLSLNKLLVSHFSVNVASKQLIKKLGFEKVGVYKRDFQKNGIWYDHVLYELLS